MTAPCFPRQSRTGLGGALLLLAATTFGILGGASADEVIGDDTSGPLYDLHIAEHGRFVFTPDGGAMVTEGKDRGEVLVAYDPEGKERWRFGRGDFPYPPAPLPDGGCVLTYFSATREWSAVRLDADGRLVAEFKGLEKMSAPSVGPDGTAYVVRAGDLLALTKDMSTRWSVRVGDRSDLRDPPHVTPSGLIIAPGSRHLVGVDPIGAVVFRRPLKKGRVLLSSEAMLGTLVVTRDPGPIATARARAELLDPRGRVRARTKLRYVVSADIIPSLGIVVVGSMRATDEPQAIVYEAGKRSRIVWSSAKTIGPGKVFDAAAGGLDTVFLSIDQGGPHVMAMGARDGIVRWKAVAPKPYVFIRGATDVFVTPLAVKNTVSRITPDEAHAPTVVAAEITPTVTIPGPGGLIALRAAGRVQVFKP